MSLSSDLELLGYPCCYSNDGTALKPMMRFDPVTKRSVSITASVDLIQKEHDPPDPQMLEELFVTVAVVGSITSLDDKLFLPVLAEYTPKAKRLDKA